MLSTSMMSGVSSGVAGRPAAGPRWLALSSVQRRGWTGHAVDMEKSRWEAALSADT